MIRMSLAIVWTERKAAATRMLALDDAALGREIARRDGPHLGAVRVIGRRWHYPLSAMHAHRYYDTRLALVGDAAHGIHPIAGQGLGCLLGSATCSRCRGWSLRRLGRAGILANRISRAISTQAPAG